MGRVQSGTAQRVRETYADLYCGTVTSGQDGAFELFSTFEMVGQVMIQNDPTNAAGEDVLIGNQHQQVWRLQPGDSVVIPVDQVPMVWVYYTAAGITINWLAVG